MITCNLMGGLGNQLFQIFTTISYALQNKNPFMFLNVSILGGGTTTIRNTYWKSLFKRLKPFLVDTFHQPVSVFREKEFRYNEIIVSSSENKNINMLYGYFQSYYYFQDTYTAICRLIGIPQLKTEIMNKINIPKIHFLNYISMHFRIGDYKKIQEYHPIMKKDYYYKSLLSIIQNQNQNQTNDWKVLYFCEEVDIDDVLEIIDYLKRQFPQIEFIRADPLLEDWEQMLFMSCCHHNIIANSSFSWWGAYFNDHEDKMVCYPSVWFGPSANHNVCDLCPSHWIKIQI